MFGIAGTGAGTGSADAVALSSSAPGTAHAAAITLVANGFSGEVHGSPDRLTTRLTTEATELLELLK